MSMIYLLDMNCPIRISSLGGDNGLGFHPKADSILNDLDPASAFNPPHALVKKKVFKSQM